MCAHWENHLRPLRFLGALRRAIAKDDGQSLRECAEKRLDRAAASEHWDTQMRADRVDGKPKQQSIVTGAEDATVAIEMPPPRPQITREEWLQIYGTEAPTRGINRLP